MKQRVPQSLLPPSRSPCLSSKHLTAPATQINAAPKVCQVLLLKSMKGNLLLLLQLQGDSTFLPRTALFPEDCSHAAPTHFTMVELSGSLQDSAFICSTEDWNRDLCLFISVSFPRGQ